MKNKTKHFGNTHPHSHQTSIEKTPSTSRISMWLSGDLIFHTTTLPYGNRCFLPPGLGLERDLIFGVRSLSFISCLVWGGSCPSPLLGEVSRLFRAADLLSPTQSRSRCSDSLAEIVLAGLSRDLSSLPFLAVAGGAVSPARVASVRSSCRLHLHPYLVSLWSSEAIRGGASWHLAFCHQFFWCHSNPAAKINFCPDPMATKWCKSPSLTGVSRAQPEAELNFTCIPRLWGGVSWCPIFTRSVSTEPGRELNHHPTCFQWALVRHCPSFVRMVGGTQWEVKHAQVMTLTLNLSRGLPANKPMLNRAQRLMI